MSVALRGNLEDFGIGEIFQLIGQQRKTGALEFKSKRERIQILLDRGSVVSAAPVGSRPDSALGDMMVRCGYLTREQVAELQRASDTSAQPISRLAVSRGQLSEAEVEAVGDLLTRETIFAVLRWENGSFDFKARPVNHDRPVDALLGAEQILMDGMRMVDEWRSFREHVPADSTVFRRSNPAATPRGGAYRQVEDARRVYDLIDGRLPVRRIIDLSRLGTFDASRVLSELRRNEMIEPVDPSTVRRENVAARIVVERRALRGWICAAIPLILLVGLVGLANRIDAARPPAQGIPIERAPIESLRQAYATRAVRHGVEMFRFRAGRWPRDLGQLGGSPDPMAAGAAPPYYTVRADDDVVLLAPER